MYYLSKTFHYLDRFRKTIIIFFAVLGPGIIVMIADNDAGGISTYAVTGSQYGFSLLWMFVILLPMAYYVQEMTVRLGAVTKRGHAEAIYDAFGPFWGWFSLTDLTISNWLTLVTEYIGMIAAMELFGIPGWITFLAVTAILFAVVIDAIGSMALYTQPNLLLAQGGALANPSVATLSNLEVGNLQSGVFGQSAAAGWLLFVLTILATVVVFGGNWLLGGRLPRAIARRRPR